MGETMGVYYIKKTINHFKKYGFLHTVRAICIFLGVFTYRKVIIYNKQLTVSDLDYTGSLHIDIASEEDIDEKYKDIWYTKEQALDKLRRRHFLFVKGLT